MMQLVSNLLRSPRRGEKESNAIYYNFPDILRNSIWLGNCSSATNPLEIMPHNPRNSVSANRDHKIHVGGLADGQELVGFAWFGFVSVSLGGSSS